MSRFQEQLQALASEQDEARRIELAAGIDGEAGDLDENWGNRDAFNEVTAERDRIRDERDSAIIERDDWKKRYADRFFDANAGETTAAAINRMHKEDAIEESRPRGYAALWQDA